MECQSHKLTVEDPVTLEYITRWVGNRWLGNPQWGYVRIESDFSTHFFCSRHVASLKQRYTQSNGRRPFGISCLITGNFFSHATLFLPICSIFFLTGFDYDKTPRLYQTDPSGTYHEWKANAIGRNSKVGVAFNHKIHSMYGNERLRRVQMPRDRTSPNSKL